MYTLYFSPGACSLATQVILRELNLPFTLVNRNNVADFQAINPVGAVPVLGHHDQVITEGAAIILHLLQNHPNDLLPQNAAEKEAAIQQLLFANATVHPTYSKLFFIASTLPEGEAQTTALQAAAAGINKLWVHIEHILQQQPYLAGERLTPADILLSVYETWGQYFNVDIQLGPKTQALLQQVRQRDSYVAAVAAEQQVA